MPENLGPPGGQEDDGEGRALSPENPATVEEPPPSSPTQQSNHRRPHPQAERTDAARPEVVTDLAADEARALTDRIKADAESLWELITQAYLGRAWIALGYQTWDAYCIREFGSARLRLPREER